MSGSYKAAIERIKAALAEHLPDRIVTRDYLPFDQRAAADLQQGVYTILCRGIDGYDYEASDHSGGLDSPDQTELGKFNLIVVGQGRLDEKCTGVEIDDAEFEMIRELESFADGTITDEDLQDLLLQRTTMSQQQDRPFYFVFTQWRLRLFN